MNESVLIIGLGLIAAVAFVAAGPTYKSRLTRATIALLVLGLLIQAWT
jgi:uncharacterized membrane protein YqjE